LQHRSIKLPPRPSSSAGGLEAACVDVENTHIAASARDDADADAAVAAPSRSLSESDNRPIPGSLPPLVSLSVHNRASLPSQPSVSIDAPTSDTHDMQPQKPKVQCAPDQRCCLSLRHIITTIIIFIIITTITIVIIIFIIFIIVVVVVDVSIIIFIVIITTMSIDVTTNMI
jgi:hypothetical protein